MAHRPLGVLTETRKQSWSFELSDAVNAPASMLQQLSAGAVDDILLVVTFAGMRPAWT